MALPEASDYDVVAGETGPVVYYGRATSGGGLFATGKASLRRVSLGDEGWGEPEVLLLPHERWRRTGPATVVRFKDKTLVYACDYWFGLLYAGIYGSEEREGFSDKFLVTPPSARDLDTELSWLLQTMTACFVAAGAIGGLARLRHFERMRSPLEEQPLYATVTDRAGATGLDFMVVYGVMWLTAGESRPVEFWTAFLFMFALYGVVSETVTRGQTLGKRLLGLRVMTVGGEPVQLGHALHRNILKFIEMLTVGVGVCLMSRRFQRPGDFLAGTVVIKELRMPKPVGE